MSDPNKRWKRWAEIVMAIVAGVPILCALGYLATWLEGEGKTPAISKSALVLIGALLVFSFVIFVCLHTFPKSNATFMVRHAGMTKTAFGRGALTTFLYAAFLWASLYVLIFALISPAVLLGDHIRIPDDNFILVKIVAMMVVAHACVRLASGLKIPSPREKDEHERAWQLMRFVATAFCGLLFVTLFSAYILPQFPDIGR